MILTKNDERKQTPQYSHPPQKESGAVLPVFFRSYIVGKSFNIHLYEYIPKQIDCQSGIYPIEYISKEG